MFRKFLHGLHPFYAPPDGDMSVGDVGSTDADIMSEDEDTTEDDSTTEEESDDEEDKEDDDTDKEADGEDKDDDDKEKDDDESKDDEDVDEEEEDEDKDLDLPPSVSEIKAKYPKFFKEFPEVRAAIFRDQAFGELFTSVNDAKAVAQKATTFDALEDDLLKKNDPTELLKSVGKYDKEALTRLSLNVLPSIQELDNDLYLRVAAIPIKQLLRAAFKQGIDKNTGKRTDLGRSALWIHQFFFGEEAKIEDPVEGEVKSKQEKSEREKELEKRVQEIDEREYAAFSKGINDSYIVNLTKEMRSALDKDARLSDFIKKTIIRDGLAEIKTQLENDNRYVQQIRSLMIQAKRSGYSSDYKSRIVSAALARAKSLAPSVRAKLVSEALGLKDTKKNKGNDKENKDTKKAKSETGEREKEKSNKQAPDKRSSKPLTDLDILRS